MFFLSLALFLLSVIYIPSSGGRGIALPWNLLFLIWSGASLLWLVCQKKNNTVRGNEPLLTLSGIAFVIIPWLCEVQFSPGVIVLTMAVIFFVILCRIPFTEAIKIKVMRLIFILSIGQAMLCLVQTFAPNFALQVLEYNWVRNNGRPYGVFQQFNLLASFLATGAGCGFLLLMLNTRPWLAKGYLAGLGLIAFVLAINQSRTGELGMTLVILALATVFLRTRTRLCLTGLLVVIAFALAGGWVTEHITVLVDGQLHTLSREFKVSNESRWNILNVTWQMIMERPWTGWGYGGFEVKFAHYLIEHPALNTAHPGVIPHPHNELLFAWFQGGVVALSGMLLMLAGWARNVVKVWRHNHAAAAYSLLILPLLVHLNLEFPFYQSFLHLGAFVVLLRMGETDSDSVKGAAYEMARRSKMLYVALALGLVGYGSCALYANNQLTAFERQGLVNYPHILPWYFQSQRRRAEFDAMVALLTDYNVTHNEDDLSQFVMRADHWLKLRIDKNVLISMMMILKHRGDNAGVAKYQKIYDAVTSTN